MNELSLQDGIRHLQAHYAKDDWVLSLRAALARKTEVCVHWESLKGSLGTLLGTAVMAAVPERPHLWMAESDTSANAYAQELKAFLGADGQVFSGFGKAHGLQKAFETWLQKKGTRVLVTTSGDVMRAVHPPAAVRVLKVGTAYDVSVWVRTLKEAGLQEVPQVRAPAQFALRGAILDYWMPDKPKGYRLEIWGDVLERIGILDADTQSAAQTLNEVIWQAPNKDASTPSAPLFDQLPARSCLWWESAHALRASEAPLDMRSHSVIILGAQADTPSKHPLPEAQWRIQRNSEATNALTGSPQWMADMLRNAADTTFIACPSESHLQPLMDALRTQLSPAHYASLHGIVAPVSEGFNDLEGRCALYVSYAKQVPLSSESASSSFGGALGAYAHAPKGRLSAPEGGGQPKPPPKKAQEKDWGAVLRGFEVGDYVVHADHGIGRFAGLLRDASGKERIQLIFRHNDLLVLSIHGLYKLSKYSSGSVEAPRLAKLGGTEWAARKQKIKRRLTALTQQLKELYAQRLRAKGWACPADDAWQAQMENAFPYRETADQLQAIQDIKSDMESAYPMDRLLCGDTGFGKTEVAIRAAFKAINHGKQVALLAPTTLLVMQHKAHFTERLQAFGVRTEALHRFVSRTQARAILEDTAQGKVDLLMGTAKLVYGQPKWRALGLFIIDEEQKFGVQMKERLRERHPEVDTLSLSATPIPRTLNFSLSGLRDISLIRTPPPGRQSTQTMVCAPHALDVRAMVARERARKGQIFWVVHRIAAIETERKRLHQHVPDLRIGTAHGQMTGDAIEDTLAQFAHQSYELLLSTNIVENGLDFPNAHTMVIQRAEQFGLADLHQLRGRVGRSDTQGYCYLLCPPPEQLTEEGRQRVRVIASFSSLGDGFKIALKDLSIRGGGQLLGREQSGFIQDIGFEQYHQLLDEVRTEQLVSTPHPTPSKKAQPLHQTRCNIETDLVAHIPSHYIQAQRERLRYYDELARLSDHSALSRLTEQLHQQFGPIPSSFQQLLDLCRLRLHAQHMGCVRLTLKRNTLKLFFHAQNPTYFQGESFARILQFVQQNPAHCKLFNTEPPHLAINPCRSPSDPLIQPLWTQ